MNAMPAQVLVHVLTYRGINPAFSGSGSSLLEEHARADCNKHKSAYNRELLGNGVGGVGKAFDLVMSCQPSVAGQSSLLPAALPPLETTLHVAVSTCQRGTYQQVDSLGYDTCKFCDRGRYNFDGEECKLCQRGRPFLH